MATVVGVDPGLDGGIAVLDLDSGHAKAWVMPTTGAGSGKRTIDVAALADLVREAAPSLAVVEAVHAMPAQGVSSVFTFGQGFGTVLGVLGALAIPVELATPQAWKKLILAGTTKDKAAAVAYARRRFPALSLMATPRSRKPHDGLADAICLAEFARHLALGRPAKEAS